MLIQVSNTIKPPANEDYLFASFKSKLNQQKLLKLFQIDKSEEIYELIISDIGIYARYRYKEKKEDALH